MRRNLERRYLDCRRGRFGNDGCIGYLPSKNQSKGSIDNTKKGDEFTFPFAAGTAKLSGRDHEFRESTPRREPTVRSQDFSRENFIVNWESQPAEPTDDAEVRGDFWSIQSDIIYRHHNDPRVQLHVPKEETFPIQKNIDVTRSTNTDLDVMQEKKIDDCWNVDSSKHLSDSWRGFTKLTLNKEKLPKDMCGPGESGQRFKRLPDQIMYGQKYGRAQNREKQEWAKEKPKLGNARKLGI